MPSIPQLVGSAEAAKILSISPTNFAHLRRNLKEAGDNEFPEPVQTLSCGPIWTASAIERFKPTFEKSRRRRRSSAEVAAERAAKEAAAAEEQPTSDAEFEASAKKKTVRGKGTPKETVEAKETPSKRPAKRPATKRPAANTSSGASANGTVQSNATKTPKPAIEGTPGGTAPKNVRKAVGATKPAAKKAALKLVKS